MLTAVLEMVERYLKVVVGKKGKERKKSHDKTNKAYKKVGIKGRKKEI